MDKNKYNNNKHTMENKKLQELTEKLYAEGLSKGREDAERMVAEAEQKAAKEAALAAQQAQEALNDQIENQQ